MIDIETLFSFRFLLWLWETGEIWGLLNELLLVLMSCFNSGGIISYHSIMREEIYKHKA